MTKLDYFIYSVKNGLYLHRAWLLSTYGIMANDYSNDFITIRDQKLYVKVKDLTFQMEELITDFAFGEPIYGKKEKVLVKNNTLPFIEGDQDTTYGRMIINCLILWYPYQGKIKYQNQYMKPSHIDDLAYELLKSGKSTVEEHIRFENACSMITCLTQTGVPSASRRSMIPNPEVPKLKKKLLEENKDKLEDPAVIADIQNQLIAADKQYLEGDSSLGFFIKGKNFNVTRLKTMGMYGAEPDFYDESKLSLMTTSLSEGWTKDNMQLLINNLRGGSFARGKETALGGESTKITSRIFQNYRIDVDDCHTAIGLKTRINKANYKNLVGRYEVGATAPLTMEVLTRYMKERKVIQLRSPAYCAVNETSFCKRCFGDQVANNGLGLNSQAIIATSAMMYISMGAMHSKQLSVAKYNFLDRIA